MAMLERVSITPMALDTDKGSREISWAPVSRSKPIPNVPHIFFDDGEPWLAANAYALHKLDSVVGNDIKTVASNMSHLKAYACWLEDNGVDWRHFPKRKKDRCLFRYRGFLIEQRKAGLVSPSTATSRMAAIIQFYRWAQVYGWVDRKSMWEDQDKTIQFYTSVGFSRTMSVVSSELAIPNRRRVGAALEDGLTPLTNENRAALLTFLFEQGKVELYLMAMIGFFTGARSETIRTLRLSNIENALDESPRVSWRLLTLREWSHEQTKVKPIFP